MTNILVTGGKGFIGSHIVDRYVELGHTVFVADHGIIENPNPEAIYVNPVSLLSLDLRTILSTNQIEVVNHHAAHVDVRRSIENPYYDAEQNIMTTLKLLEACVESGVKKFIYASSGGAINNSEQPDSPYGIAKLTTEKYIKFFQKHHELKTICLRYSNVYGPRQTGGVIPIFVKKMLKNEDVIMNGGQQIRDFIYVKDVCEINTKALGWLEEGPPLDTVNVSTGQGTSIYYLTYKLKELCNSTSNIIRNPPIKGEVFSSTLEPTFPALFPQTPLEDGLKSVIDSLR